MSQENYTLSVPLPSLNRRVVTPKRRRILHLVADDWDNGGSESRSSAVVAEFSEKMLRVVIPQQLQSRTNIISAYL